MRPGFRAGSNEEREGEAPAEPVFFLACSSAGASPSRYFRFSWDCLAQESEALVPIQMELKRIIISEVHDQQVIMLKEVEGDRSFPIVIGIFEATSIDRRVKKLPPPRPLTHELVASVIENMGGQLRDIFISALLDHTYSAKLPSRLADEIVTV